MRLTIRATLLGRISKDVYARFAGGHFPISQELDEKQGLA